MPSAVHTTSAESPRTDIVRDGAAVPRVVIAHEWLVSYAGSERCVHEMLEVFPDAMLLTTILEESSVPPDLRRARPSFLQHVPGATRHHEWLVPLMPLAWRLRTPVREADVVISSSHACAKAVRMIPGIPHVCYSHTPMRYAWSFEAERERFPRPLRPLARAGMGWFRHWDRKTAQGVTAFVANSSAVAERIRAAFGRSAYVIHPPVQTDFFTVGGARADYFLYVGRLVGYKRPDLVVDAFRDLPEQRLIVIGEGPMAGPLQARATSNVEFVGSVSAESLRDYYRGAQALVYPVEEDFGIAMAEAQACGTPVIGLSTGGATDIVEHGRTGWLLSGQSLSELRSTVRLAASATLDPVDISSRASRFSAARFRSEIGAVARQYARHGT
jgi:glycosyltransferase involved in cell wall biosynthesis